MGLTLPSSQTDMPSWLVLSEHGELSVRPPMLSTVDGLSVSGWDCTDAPAATAAAACGPRTARPWGDAGADVGWARGDTHSPRDWGSVRRWRGLLSRVVPGVDSLRSPLEDWRIILKRGCVLVKWTRHKDGKK